MWSLNFRIAIALTCGYITKFILDRTFVFPDKELNEQDHKEKGTEVSQEK